MTDKPRVLITNFHPHMGGGHVTSIRNIVTSKLTADIDFAVASPEGSLLLDTARQAGVTAFPCDFPSAVGKELPDIIRAVRRFRRVVDEFRPQVGPYQRRGRQFRGRLVPYVAEEAFPAGAVAPGHPPHPAQYLPPLAVPAQWST